VTEVVPALDISLLHLAFPTVAEEERQRTFRTLSNYIEAWASYLDDEIGVRPRCPVGVVVSADQFSGLARRVEFEEAKRYLSLSWATEVLMHLNMTTLGNTESIRYANAWLPIQTYYAVYTAVLALNSLVESRPADNHQAQLHAINSTLMDQRKWLPSAYRTACLDLPQDGPATFTPFDAGADLAYSNLIRISDPGQVRALVAKSLKTTRKAQIERLRELKLKREKSQRLPTGGWNAISNALMPTTVFDLLFRLRLRSNYRETDTLVLGPWSVDEAHSFSEALVDLTWHLLALLETLISGVISTSEFTNLVREFGERGSSISAVPVLERWQP
jgi:hypothetical protein